MKKKKTDRGFSIVEFKDRTGAACSLQKSSLALVDAIWLGSNKIGLKEFKAGKGWIDREEFDKGTIAHHYIANNRMHLTRKQVKKLLPLLQKFVDTGDI